jgi:hypothetical protein
MITRKPLNKKMENKLPLSGLRLKRLVEDVNDELETASTSDVEYTIVDPEELEKNEISELVLFVSGIPDDHVEEFITEFNALVSKYNAVTTDGNAPLPQEPVGGIPSPEEPTPHEPEFEFTGPELLAGSGVGASELVAPESEEELLGQEAIKIWAKRILESRGKLRKKVTRSKALESRLSKRRPIIRRK